MDDPLYVEEEEDDYWYRGYNMRTGERGIFPAFYAHEVIGQSKELLGECKNTAAYFFFFAFLFETHRTITFSMHITLRRNEKESSVD